MVDGVDVGVDEKFHHAPIDLNQDNKKEAVSFTEHYQTFAGADLIVIDGYGSREIGEESGKTKESYQGCRWKVYPLYAVYGDKRVISSEVSEMTLSKYYEMWKDKLILARKKPYILSGD